MKALEKDRNRRYETANGLAGDIQRYLADEPVEACPPSAGYRLRKLARKYKKPLGAAAAFGLLLLASLAVVTWKWQAERVARGDADAARRDAEDKAREIQEGVERLNAANAAMDLAQQHARLDQWTAAAADYERAIELRPDHSQVWIERGEFYGEMGLWDLAFQDYTRAFDLGAPYMVRPWFKYALLHLLRGDEAGYGRVCRQMRERFGGSNEVFIQVTLNRFCSLAPSEVPGYDWKADPVLDITNYPPTMIWAGHYGRGLVHFRAGRYKEAVRELRASLAKTNGPARALNYPVLAMALHRSGEPGAARKELENSRKELEQWTQSALNSPDRFVPWRLWYDWAEFLFYHAEARRLIEQAPPAEDPRQRILRGRALTALGRHAQAEAEYSGALRLAPNDPQIREEIQATKAAARAAADP
jgi:tetratricopeptide (TPR) repeat protein